MQWRLRFRMAQPSGYCAASRCLGRLRRSQVFVASFVASLVDVRRDAIAIGIEESGRAGEERIIADSIVRCHAPGADLALPCLASLLKFVGQPG